MSCISLLDLLSMKIADCETFEAEIYADVNCVLNKKIVVLRHRCLIVTNQSAGNGMMIVEITDKERFDYEEIVEFDDFLGFIGAGEKVEVNKDTKNYKFTQIYKEDTTDTFQLFTLSPDETDDIDGYLRSLLSIEKLDDDAFFVNYQITWVENDDDILTNEYIGIIIVD